MEQNSSSMVGMMDVDFDDEDWNPTPAGRLYDTLGLAEQAAKDANRAAAGQMSAIASAVEAARQAPDVYVDELFNGGVRGRELVVRSVVFDLSVRLGMSTVTVRTLADQAERMQARLPRIWAKFHAGEISEPNARILTDAIAGLDHRHDTAFEEQLLHAGMTLLPAKLRVKARTVREHLEHETRQERHERSARERRVYIEDDVDGMAWLHLYSNAADIYRAKARIDATATQLHGVNANSVNASSVDGEARTLAQLRADVTADLLTGQGTPAEVKTSIFVTVPILNLIGKNLDGVAPEMATLEGYGPIDDDTAARLFAAAGSFRRIATDPITGIRLTMDRTTYRPTADQKAWLRLQYRSCAAPGCNRPAAHCDIDHTLDWQYNGPTNSDNLAPICRATHILKSETKLKVTRNNTGTLRFSTPTGATNDSDPPPY